MASGQCGAWAGNISGSLRLAALLTLFTPAQASDALRIEGYTSDPVPMQPSLVAINGRQLLVRRRNLDGSLAPEAPYIIRGVNWSPASTTTATSSEDPDNVSVRRPEFGLWYQTDIPLLKAMNVNTVRLFMDPGIPGDPNVSVSGLTILDDLYRNGIMVIMTVDNGNNTVSRIGPVVDYYKNHPAILLWSLGSEWNLNRFWKPADFPTVDSAAAAIESAAQEVKAHDIGHPVASSYGSIFNKPNDFEKYVNQTCPSIDVWSFNEYRGPGFSRFFEQWGLVSGKPMFLAEYGIDAFNSVIQDKDESTHARWGGQLWDEIARNLSADNPANVALGGTIFEWNDEWWKEPPWQTQDPGGWNLPGFPDGMTNEDWWGIVTIGRVPRPLFDSLTTRFASAYQPPPPAASITYRVVSHPGDGANVLLTRFWENGAVMFQGEGPYFVEGALVTGGRGFNIVAINPATGKLRDPIQQFDTYASRDSGTAMNAMITYLDSLPNGTLVLIAVGDEAGLNADLPDRCQFLPYTWVTTAQQSLQSLGSTKIQNYCYQDQWSMIAVKGQGAVLSEALSDVHGGDAETLAALGVPTRRRSQTTSQ